MLNIQESRACINYWAIHPANNHFHKLQNNYQFITIKSRCHYIKYTSYSKAQNILSKQENMQNIHLQLNQGKYQQDNLQLLHNLRLINKNLFCSFNKQFRQNMLNIQQSIACINYWAIHQANNHFHKMQSKLILSKSRCHYIMCTLYSKAHNNFSKQISMQNIHLQLHQGK